MLETMVPYLFRKAISCRLRDRITGYFFVLGIFLCVPECVPASVSVYGIYVYACGIHIHSYTDIYAHATHMHTNSCYCAAPIFLALGTHDSFLLIHTIHMILSCSSSFNLFSSYSSSGMCSRLEGGLTVCILFIHAVLTHRVILY
jgi:hypothetical protein